MASECVSEGVASICTEILVGGTRPVWTVAVDLSLLIYLESGGGYGWRLGRFVYGLMGYRRSLFSSLLEASSLLS